MSDTTRFTHPMLRRYVFVRRPVAEPPIDGTVGFVDDGHATGWHRKPIAGLFKNGVWTNDKGRRLSFVPTFWTSIQVRSDAG